MSEVLRPTRHITGIFGDKSLQAIDYTGTDNQTHYDEENVHRNTNESSAVAQMAVQCYMSQIVKDRSGSVSRKN